MKRLLVILAAATLLCVVMGACGSKPEYDPLAYATVEVTGLNTVGVVTLKTERLSADDGKLKTLLSEVTYHVSPEDNLTNGDTVTITAEYDEEEVKRQGYKPIQREKTIIVKDLEEGIHLDLFADLEVTFEEAEPNGFANIENKSQDAFIKELDYEADKIWELSNGDTITVTVLLNQETARREKYVIRELSKQYTVSGLPAYVTSPTQLSTDFLSEIYIR